MAFVVFILIFYQLSNAEVHCQPTFPIGTPSLSGTCDYLRSSQQFLQENAAMVIQKQNCVNGGTGSSWNQVAHLNMRNTSHTCPSNWRTVTTPIRACRRRSSYVCNSAFYSTGNISYTHVSGKIIGYQFGGPDGFSNYINRNFSIEDHYLDGVSITHGQTGSRKHIWSFVSGHSETNSGSMAILCPCTVSTWSLETPPFVGMDYFCESGSRDEPSAILYDNDPLWDASGCRDNDRCCHFNQPPWFCKILNGATTGDIEVRICADNDVNEEDIFITDIEIYVR